MLETQALVESETALFREWRDVNPNMVADGVVNPAAYCECQNRVLFVMKEVNDLGGGGWDLREFLQEGGRPQTWDNVTRWLTAINKLPANTNWSELETITEEDRKVALDSIATMNLKKEPGGHTAVYEQVAIAAKDNITLLERQFDLYCAELTICCGVGDLAYEIVFGSDGPRWQKTTRGIRYCEIGPKRFMVAYSHPEARISAPLLIYGLVDAVKEIRENITA